MNFKTRTADFSGLAVIEKKICLKRDLLLAYARLGPLDGNASYRNYIIDALFHLRSGDLEKGAKYEII